MIIYLFQFLLFLLCLIASAFFAAWETALMSVSLSGWERMRRERSQVQDAYALWSGDPSLVIAALLFGNVLTNLGGSVAIGSTVGELFAKLPLPSPVVLFVSSLL